MEVEAAAHSSDSHQLPAAAGPREENAAHAAQRAGPATDGEGSSPCGPTSSRALSKEFSLTDGAGGAGEHRRAASPRQKVPRETNCSRTHCCDGLGQMGQCCLLNPPVRKQKHHPIKTVPSDKICPEMSFSNGRRNKPPQVHLSSTVQAQLQISSLCSPPTSHQIERRVLRVHQVTLGLLAFHHAYDLLHLEIKLWPPKGKQTSTLKCLAKTLKEGTV